MEALKGSNVEVYLDGGIRRGTDIVKALALGARFVFIGRPVLWGLAYKVKRTHKMGNGKGEKGVQLVLEMLKKELHRAMALVGKLNLKIHS